MNGWSTRRMVFCALFAAVIAVFAQIQIPMAPVPVSLATFGVMMCGLLLGWKWGAVTVTVYILLGVVGVPVFAGFKGGAAVLMGPTGGYILGYLPYAVLAGLPVTKMQVPMLPIRIAPIMSPMCKATVSPVPCWVMWMHRLKTRCRATTTTSSSVSPRVSEGRMLPGRRKANSLRKCWGTACRHRWVIFGISVPIIIPSPIVFITDPSAQMPL